MRPSQQKAKMMAGWTAICVQPSKLPASMGIPICDCYNSETTDTAQLL